MADTDGGGQFPATQPDEIYLKGAHPGASTYPTAQPAPTVPQPMRRAPLNYQPNEGGWWLAADGLWYPPETAPGAQQAAPPPAITNPQTGSQNIVIHMAAPPQPTYPAFVTGPPKSRVAAGLLQIFFGGFGIGRFYLGYGGIGVAQLLVTLITCGVGAIWGLIDGIIILCGGVKTDAQGVPLQ